MAEARLHTYGRKLSASIASKTLSRMLQSTRQSFPTMKLATRKGGFGVFSDDGTYLYVSFSGNLTLQAKQDLLALFSVWLRADPENLEPSSTRLDGQSVKAPEV